MGKSRLKKERERFDERNARQTVWIDKVISKKIDEILEVSNGKKTDPINDALKEYIENPKNLYKQASLILEEHNKKDIPNEESHVEYSKRFEMIEKRIEYLEYVYKKLN